MNASCRSLSVEHRGTHMHTCYTVGLEGAAEMKLLILFRNFWGVVHEFSEDQKKQFLQFVTGTDRVPLGGLSKLKFMIVKNGSDSDR